MIDNIVNNAIGFSPLAKPVIITLITQALTRTGAVRIQAHCCQKIK